MDSLEITWKNVHSVGRSENIKVLEEVTVLDTKDKPVKRPPAYDIVL